MTKTDCTKKTCHICKKTKPIGDFQKNRSRACGVQAACRTCHITTVSKNRQQPSSLVKRRYALKKKYGITVSQYDEMYSRQHGKCAICGRIPIRMVVDHDHTTNKVRKLLCDYCNMIVGIIETKGDLRPYYKYIIKHQ